VNRILIGKAKAKPLTTLCVSAVLLLGSQCVAGPQLNQLLERTGRRVELFWQQVPFFTCTESVRQKKFGKKGKAEYREDSVFDYLAITEVQDGDLTVEELRLPQKMAKNKPNKPPLLKTNGFATLLLIFHPQYQADYRYQFEQEDGTNDKLLRIGFEHIPGTPSTCALMLKNMIYPLDLRGTAWIDKETGFIQKITAGLVAAPKDINIEVFTIEVTYKAQSLSSEPELKWLPSTAVIDVQTARQGWRNIHSFSQYKRFSVEEKESLSP
jgi:hypothetical protein